LLIEELDFIPVSMQIEEQVRKLRTLETALHKAGRASEFSRRQADHSADKAERMREFNFSNRSRYLVPIAVRLKLQTGELCYLKAAASWRRVNEIRIDRGQLANPALPTKHLSIRRKGESPKYPECFTGNALIAGQFYLTNRRLILISQSRPRVSISLRAAYCRAVYKDAIEIFHSDRAGGKTCCDVLYLPEGDIQMADSLFQSLGG